MLYSTPANKTKKSKVEKVEKPKVEKVEKPKVEKVAKKRPPKKKQVAEETLVPASKSTEPEPAQSEPAPTPAPTPAPSPEPAVPAPAESEPEPEPASKTKKQIKSSDAPPDWFVTFIKNAKKQDKKARVPQATAAEIWQDTSAQHLLQGHNERHVKQMHSLYNQMFRR